MFQKGTFGRVLLFAPHPDDETIGAGGYLALAVKKKWAVKIVVVTRGELFTSTDDSEDVRAEEFLRAISHLGIEGGDCELWSYPDGMVPLGGKIIEDYRMAVKKYLPDVILLPAPTDTHRDHRRVTRGVIRALTGRLDRSVELRFYEVTTPCSANYVEDISSVYRMKAAALDSYESQLGRYDYRGTVDALSKFRGRSVGCSRGEAFLVFPWSGTDDNFFELYPQVSVIIRSSDQVYLGHALTSIMHQHYDHLEVVIVWFGDETPDVSKGFEYLDLKIIKGVRGSRGANLNLGIDAAAGDYITFLDEDDVWDPSHIENLLSVLHSRRALDIAYSGCRAVVCRFSGCRVEALREDRIFNEGYRRGRLILQNHIPLNALMVRSHVFRNLRFAEDIEAYEDWLFLAMAELRGFTFFHSSMISAEYRIFGESYEAVHREKGYTELTDEVRRRIFENMTPEHLGHISQLYGDSRFNARRDEEKNSRQINEYRLNTERLEERIVTLERDRNMLLKNESAIISMGKRFGINSRGGLDTVHRLILGAMKYEPVFSIIISVFNTPGDILAKALASIESQIYTRWELCLVDDGSRSVPTLDALESFLDSRKGDGRIRFERNENCSGISRAFNRAAELATGEYLVIMDHDDFLHPEAILEAAIARNRTCYRFLYTDSSIIDPEGKPLFYHNKPDWAPETLFFMNYINHLAVIERGLWCKLGGFSPEMDGSQDWDLFLRMAGEVEPGDVVHINRDLYGWRAIKGSTACSMDAKPWAVEKWEPLLRHHHGKIHGCLSADGQEQGTIELTLNERGPGFFCRSVSKKKTSVIDVIIPSADNPGHLSECIASLQGDDYPLKHIIVVNNGSFKLKTRELLGRLEAQGVTIVEGQGDFNWSRLNNLAMKRCRGEAHLFLNDDVVLEGTGILRTLVQYLDFNSVGIVGAKLKYPDGEIQHNGIVLDPSKIACSFTKTGVHGEFTLPRNVSAVTGACMLVRKKTFCQIGGFNEDLPVNYNDVDFCLEALDKKWRIMLVPEVSIVHHHMASRGEESLPRGLEISYMQKKWEGRLEERYTIEWERVGADPINLKLLN